MTESAALASALHKAARRLTPFMGLLFLVSFLDRANVSFAALVMNKDLGFTPTIYSWGVGFFFFGYVLFEVPSNIMVHRIGARRWIGPIVIVWGLASIALFTANGARTFFPLRFVLGAAEAGFLPGMLLYLTYWFPPGQRARMTALFMMAIPLSIVIGAPLSGAILSMDSLNGLWGLKNWQWLFVIEGLPAILLGLMVFEFLPDRPRDAAWLTPEEKAALESELARSSGGSARHESLGAGLFSGPVLLLGLAYFCALIGGFGIIFWVPQIVKAFGLSNLETGLVASIPYIASSIAMYVLGRLGDRTGRRVLLTVVPMLLGAFGLVLAGSTGNPYVSIFALSLAACGIYGMLPSFWTLPTVYLQGPAAAGGFAMINSIGAIGGFVGPFIIGWVKEHRGEFGSGLTILGAGAALTAILVLVLVTVYRPPEQA